MIIALWIVTALLALLFLAAGLTKSATAREKLIPRMGYMEDLSNWQARGIGILELLGALGLVLPAATGILPWLTPVAGLGLVITMIVATAVHVRRKESPVVSIVIGVVVLAVSIGWIVLG